MPHAHLLNLDITRRPTHRTDRSLTSALGSRFGFLLRQPLDRSSRLPSSKIIIPEIWTLWEFQIATQIPFPNPLPIHPRWRKGQKRVKRVMSGGHRLPRSRTTGSRPRSAPPRPARSRYPKTSFSWRGLFYQLSLSIVLVDILLDFLNQFFRVSKGTPNLRL